MATQQNGTATLAEQLAALGLTPMDLEKTIAEKSGGTRVDIATGAPVELDPIAGELAQLRAENARLKAQKASTAGTLTPHVSEKGALSVYGLGRFPVTLYAEQWERLLAFAPQVKAFAVKHLQTPEVRTIDGVQVSRKLTRQ